MRQDMQAIVQAALRAALPDEPLARALAALRFPKEGRLLLIAVGKAAWPMARSALQCLGDRIESGLVITKDGHSGGELPRTRILEAGHPEPDARSFAAAREALALVRDLKPRDRVLLLLSGGGSALFELPLIPEQELIAINRQLLSRGADITQINAVRKRLSAVKGGRFALACQPARVITLVLSDVVGAPPDMVASGPSVPDSAGREQALDAVRRYRLELSPQALARLAEDPPRLANPGPLRVLGSVRLLCEGARKAAAALGYEPRVLTQSLSCQAREAGAFLGAIAQYHQKSRRSLAFLAAGETVVTLTGSGKGGRNQELALAAAEKIGGLESTAVFSLGSDGTDGPTDAAGGYADGETRSRLEALGISIPRVLADNDAYTALGKADGLIFTGPTGTNVNDLSVLLIRRLG